MSDDTVYHWWCLLYKYECKETTYPIYVKTKKKLLPESKIERWDNNAFLINVNYLGKGTIAEFNK